MAKLIYSMITSLDGYAEATEGDLGSGAEDQEVHTFINDLFRPVGTYLYGQRGEGHLGTALTRTVGTGQHCSPQLVGRF